MVPLQGRLGGRGGQPQPGGRAHRPPRDRRVPAPPAGALGRARGPTLRRRLAARAAGQPRGGAEHPGGSLPGESGGAGARDLGGQGGNGPVPAGVPGAVECQDGSGHGDSGLQETAGRGGDVVEFLFANGAEMMGGG